MSNTVLPLIERQQEYALHAMPEPEDDSPRNRLLQAAVLLCATHGFEAVTVRDITTKADANLASICYYYGSKQSLLQTVFQTAVKPIHAAMLGELAAYEELEIGPGLQLAPIWGCMAGPLVRYAMEQTGWSAQLARIYIRAALKPNSKISLKIKGSCYDELFTRYAHALSKALPRLTMEEIHWRMYFAWGTILASTRDIAKNYSFRRYSNGTCDTGDSAEVLRNLVRFVTAATMDGAVDAVPRVWRNRQELLKAVACD